MSSARRQSAQAAPQDIAPVAPQTTPPNIGYGHPEYQFVQAIMEMQKSLGQINASIEALQKSVDSTKSKVEDLVKWKQMILGGAAVLSVIVSVIIFCATKVSDYVTFKSPSERASVQKMAPPIEVTPPPISQPTEAPAAVRHKSGTPTN